MAKFYAVRVGNSPGIFTSWDECKASVEGYPGAKYKSFSTMEQAEEYIAGKDVPSGKRDGKQADATNDIPKPSAKPSHYIEFPTKDTQKSATEYEADAREAMKHLDAIYAMDLISKDMYDKVQSGIGVRIAAKMNYQQRMEARNWAPYPEHALVYVDGSYNPETNEYGYGVYLDDGEKQQILFGRGECAEGGRNVEGEVAGAKAALDYVKLNPHYKSVVIYHDYQGIGSWANKDWQANKAYSSAYARYVGKLREKGLMIDFVHVDGHTGVEGNEYVDKIAKIACGVELTSKDKEFIKKIEDVPGFPTEMPERDPQQRYTMMGDYVQSSKDDGMSF